MLTVAYNDAILNFDSTNILLELINPEISKIIIPIYVQHSQMKAELMKL